MIPLMGGPRIGKVIEIESRVRVMEKGGKQGVIV